MTESEVIIWFENNFVWLKYVLAFSVALGAAITVYRLIGRLPTGVECNYCNKVKPLVISGEITNLCKECAEFILPLAAKDRKNES